ncbi:MAG: IS1096 element passenger TnpR family protein [Bacteroidota bacterium]
MGALKFRVLLDTEQEAEIFRDILVDENDNFESLYQAIISSFRFEGDQMASFYMSNDDWDKGHEISLMDMNYGDEAIDEKASVMSAAILRDFMEAPDQKMILVYDFMRMWIFLVELIERSNDQVDKAQTVLSVGMAPPEDSRMANFDEEEDDLNEFGDDPEADEDDIYGDDFEDGYDDDDLKNYDDY